MLAAMVTTLRALSCRTLSVSAALLVCSALPWKILTQHFLLDVAAGEGRDRRLNDIAKCDAQAETLLRQAESVPLTLVCLCWHKH